MVALGMGTRSEQVQYQSTVSPRVGAMQLHELHKYASELEQSGGGRGRAEAEGVGGGQRWPEKGKGGHTMTVGGMVGEQVEDGVEGGRAMECIGVVVEFLDIVA